MTTHAPTTAITTILGEWLALLDREGVSARNRDAHRMGVERFAEYVRPRSIDDATATDIRGFLAYLGELGVSEQSQGVYRQILEKWVMFAMQERRRVDTASAAVAALSDAAQESSDSTMVLDIPGFAGASSVQPLTPWSDEPLTEAQADSTWPQARRTPTSAAPVGILAAAFDGLASADAPAAALTIDVAPMADLIVEAEAPVDAPCGMAGGFAFDSPARDAASFAPIAPAPALLPPLPAAGGFAFGAAPVTPADLRGGLSLDGAGENAASFFGSPPSPSYNEPSAHAEAAAMAAEPDADATPARPIQAEPMAPPPRQHQAKDADGDHLMDAGVASIPLAAPAIGIGRKTDDKRKPSLTEAPAALKAKVQGWGLRCNGTERNDLDLAQIRNMVAMGTLSPSALIRKPGGEWTKAGEYQPLRSVFQQAKDGVTSRGMREAERPRDPLAHPAAMAWLGAAIGAVVGAGAWWVAAVIAGAEVLPMAILVAALSGGLASWLGRGESMTAIGASAVATLAAMIVGRAAVYQTMAAGVMGEGRTEAVDPLAFLAASATAASLTWWGIAILLAAAVGGLGLFLRKR